MPNLWWWVGFNALVLALLAVDLGVFNRKPHAVSVREANKSVPPAVDAIVLGLLNKNPDKRRPATARELAEALEAIADKNGWKWAIPPLLAGETIAIEMETPTAAIPGSA